MLVVMDTRPREDLPVACTIPHIYSNKVILTFQSPTTVERVLDWLVRALIESEHAVKMFFA